MPTLYSLHSPALSVLYGDIERQALDQREAFIGTAGSVIERTNAAGFRFYAHKAYDAEGRAREHYVAGPIGSADADAAAEALRVRIRETKEQVPRIRLLGREGFSLIDPRAYATIAALHNHRIFDAGGLLVGSHAYGVLLNRLGIRAAPYLTRDVDVARGAPLTLATPLVLLEVLRESGLELFEVPPLDRKAPATSFKVRGRTPFHVDLLAPSRGDASPVVPVPELHAHATGLPFLDYLLVESQPGMVITREGFCAVRVPLAEQFAIHKLLVSQLRANRSAQSRKDLDQAATLAAALGDLFPGALATARAAVPRRALKRLRAAIEASEALLRKDAPRAWEELTS